jgi:hypothetical protein
MISHIDILPPDEQKPSLPGNQTLEVRTEFYGLSLDMVPKAEKKVADETKNKNKEQIKDAKEKLEKARKDEQKLTNPIMVVSLFAEDSDDKHLCTTAALIKKYHANNQLKQITVYVTGLLQRHNFWNFTKDKNLLSDAKLAVLLQDLMSLKYRENLTVRQLALLLADKFSGYAAKAENEYIRKLKKIFYKNQPMPESAVTFHKWFDVLKPKYPEPYLAYYQKVLNNFKENKEGEGYQKVFLEIVTQQIGSPPKQNQNNSLACNDQRAKQQEILKQAKRILDLLELQGTFTPFELSEACCLNYLLEECAGFPILTTGEWSSVLYPSPKKGFFTLTEELCLENKEIDWIQIVHTNIPNKYSSSNNIELPSPLTPIYEEDEEEKQDEDTTDFLLFNSDIKREDVLLIRKPKHNGRNSLIPLEKPTSQQEQKSGLVIEDKEEIKRINWLKEPMQFIDNTKRLSYEVKTLDLTVDSSSNKLSTEYDLECKSIFIKAMERSFNSVVSINLKRNFIRFSSKSSLEMFLAVAERESIQKFNLSCNLLHEFNVSDLSVIFKNARGEIILSYNNLFNFGEQDLVVLFNHLSSVVILDLSNNGLNKFSTEQLSYIFENLPSSIKELRLSGCFENRRTPDINYLVWCIPNTVKKIKVKGRLGLIINEMLNTKLKLHSIETNVINSIVQEIQDSAKSSLLLQFNNPISTFFKLSKSVRLEVQAVVAKVCAAKTLDEVISSINNLLLWYETKGEGLYNNSFDTVFIRNIYESHSLPTEKQKTRQLISDLYGSHPNCVYLSERDRLPYKNYEFIIPFRLPIINNPSEPKLSHVDRNNVIKAFTKLLEDFKRYSSDLQMHYSTHSVYHEPDTRKHHSPKTNSPSKEPIRTRTFSI